MKITKTEIEGVVILEPDVFGDSRGYFFESYSKRVFDEAVKEEVFVQDNQSKSTYGVVRGLHFQRPPHTQSKLVRVIEGRVLDVAVDLRKGSSTYGQHVAVELSADNNRQLYIPEGFAHGFSVLSREAVFQYKCNRYYCHESEGGIAWDDPDLNIDWKIPAEDVILSDKDRNRINLAEFNSPF